MKKVFTGFLGVVIVLALSACGGMSQEKREEKLVHAFDNTFPTLEKYTDGPIDIDSLENHIEYMLTLPAESNEENFEQKQVFLMKLLDLITSTERENIAVAYIGSIDTETDAVNGMVMIYFTEGHLFSKDEAAEASAKAKSISLDFDREYIAGDKVVVLASPTYLNMWELTREDIEAKINEVEKFMED